MRVSAPSTSFNSYKAAPLNISVGAGRQNDAGDGQFRHSFVDHGVCVPVRQVVHHLSVRVRVVGSVALGAHPHWLEVPVLGQSHFVARAPAAEALAAGSAVVNAQEERKLFVSEGTRIGNIVRDPNWRLRWNIYPFLVECVLFINFFHFVSVVESEEILTVPVLLIDLLQLHVWLKCNPLAVNLNVELCHELVVVNAVLRKIRGQEIQVVN